MERVWVPGWEDSYSLTADGKVWSHKRRGLREMRPGRGTPYGHVKVHFSRGQFDREGHWVHRLMLLAFVGPPAEGQIARHLDGNPANNALSNLAWGTPTENNADMVRHGRSTRGSSNTRSILTEEQVVEIRQLRHLRAEDLAERYGVKPNTIYGIWSRRSWGWLRDAG